MLFVPFRCYCFLVFFFEVIKFFVWYFSASRLLSCVDFNCTTPYCLIVLPHIAFLFCLNLKNSIMSFYPCLFISMLPKRPMVNEIVQRLANLFTPTLWTSRYLRDMLPLSGTWNSLVTMTFSCKIRASLNYTISNHLVIIKYIFAKTEPH